MSGRARHGKTESTEAIKSFAESQGETVKVYDVGDMIRRLCIATGRLPQVERVDMTKEQIQVLIDVGKEERTKNRNVWIERVVQQAITDNPDVAMCPNLRLPLEAEEIRKIGGVIIRCTRMNPDGSLYISPDRDPNDITETALQFWPADHYITYVSKPDARLVRMQAVTLYKYLTGFTE